MDEIDWIEFQKHLTNLTNSFYCLLPESKTRAVSALRECLGHMQSALKQQLCSDGMRTVAALAESMIQVYRHFQHMPFCLLVSSKANMYTKSGS